MALPNKPTGATNLQQNFGERQGPESDRLHRTGGADTIANVHARNTARSARIT